MCITNTALVEYARAQVGNPYIFGTFGQIGNAKLLAEKHSQWPRYVTDKRVEIVKANPDHYYGKPWHDCSGLIKAALMKKNLTVSYNQKYDLDADSFYRKAQEKGPISTIPEIIGLGLWRSGHIGVYIGGGRCVQAKGFDYGVIESDLFGFTNWCKLPFIDYSDTAAAPALAPQQPSEKELDIWVGYIKTERDDLNIRQSSDPDSPCIGTVKRETYQVFSGEVINGMARLANGPGWCSARYISKVL